MSMLHARPMPDHSTCPLDPRGNHSRALWSSPMGFPLLIVMIICTVSLQLIMTSCSGNEHETTHKHTNTHTHTHRGDSGKTRHLLILMQCTVGCRTVGCQMLYCGVIMGPVWPTRPADKRTACGHDMCPEQTQKCPDQHTWCVLADILNTPKEPWARSS